MLSLLPADLMPAQNATLVVAFSGGLDSTVLLHLARQWQQTHTTIRLRAIHVHHGLSPHADAWAQHCQSLCAAWAIPLRVCRVQVESRDGGVEAGARRARYQALREALTPGDYLLTAQHLDDQCETLLLALKRGSGPAGLAAMPALRECAGYMHLRPLLNCSRQQLEAWAAQHQLGWIEDESNQDARYDRNFLRHEVVPLLSQRWPHFAAAAARSAQLCGEQEQLLDELLAGELAALQQPDGSLTLTLLLTMSDARRYALLRRWIRQQGGEMPSRDALQRIVQEVMLSREDAQPRLQLGANEIRRYRQQLWWLPAQPCLRDRTLLWPQLLQPLVLPAPLGRLRIVPDGGAVRPPLPDEQVTVRFQASGDHHIVGRAGGRSMKKLWQEMGIPPWQRTRIPLIYYNQILIGAPGLFVTHAGAAADGQGWQFCWEKPA